MSDKLEADNKSEISEFPIPQGWPWHPMGPCSETSCGHPKNSTAESIAQYEAELACDNLISQLCEGASILKMDTSEYLVKLAAIFGKSDKRDKLHEDSANTTSNLTADKTTADNLTAYKPSDDLMIIATFIHCQFPKHLCLTYDDKKPTDKEERENSAYLDGSDKEEPAEPENSKTPEEPEEPEDSEEQDPPEELAESGEPETKSIKKAAKS